MPCVDKVLATFGDELYAISFGNELDRYFGSQSNKNATELAALVEHGIDYLKKHPAKPPSLRVGATFSAEALTGVTSASVKNIIDKSDVVVATYYPLDSSFAARPPSMVAQDLDALRWRWPRPTAQRRVQSCCKRWVIRARSRAAAHRNSRRRSSARSSRASPHAAIAFPSSA